MSIVSFDLRGSNIRFEWSFGSLVRPVGQVMLLLCCVVGFSMDCFSQAGIQVTSSKADFTKRSAARVDTSTLGLNIEIPLGSYPPMKSEFTPPVTSCYVAR